jgi:hypothetical protein
MVAVYRGQREQRSTQEEMRGMGGTFDKLILYSIGTNIKKFLIVTLT